MEREINCFMDIFLNAAVFNQSININDLKCANLFPLFLLQARLFDEPQLASLCLDTIDKSTADAINAEGFTDIDLGM